VEKWNRVEEDKGYEIENSNLFFAVLFISNRERAIGEI